MSTHDCQDDIGSIARRDDGNAFLQPLQYVLGSHTRHENIHRLARQQGGVARNDGALDGGLQFGDRRRDQQRLLGQLVAFRAKPFQCRIQRRHRIRVAAVGHHRRGVCVLGTDLGKTYVDDLGYLFRTAVLGLHREHDGRAEIGRYARVRRQLARRGHIGVVTADDQDRVALVGHPVIPVDYVADGGVGVLVQLLVTDANAVLVCQSRGGLRKQKFQDVVAVFAEARDRTEDTDLGDGGCQAMQDAQRDCRLARVALW